MTEFLQSTQLVTENGKVVDEQEMPIVQTKKLNGQGTIFKLTDANCESINSQRERGGVINVDKFIRSVRSHFGPGHYDVDAIAHLPLPDELKELGMIRVGIHGTVDITNSQYHWGEVADHSLYILMWEGAVLGLDSWYGFVKKAHEDNEVGDDFLEICDAVMELAPSQVSQGLANTMFGEHLDYCDKVIIMRDRVYETAS